MSARIDESAIANEAATAVIGVKEVVTEMENVIAEIVNEAGTDVEDRGLRADDEADHLTVAEKK